MRDIRLSGNRDLEIRKMGDQGLSLVPEYPNTQILIPQLPDYRI